MSLSPWCTQGASTGAGRDISILPRGRGVGAGAGRCLPAPCQLCPVSCCFCSACVSSREGARCGSAVPCLLAVPRRGLASKWPGAGVSWPRGGQAPRCVGWCTGVTKPGVFSLRSLPLEGAVRILQAASVSGLRGRGCLAVGQREAASLGAPRQPRLVLETASFPLQHNLSVPGPEEAAKWAPAGQVSARPRIRSVHVAQLRGWA